MGLVFLKWLASIGSRRHLVFSQQRESRPHVPPDTQPIISLETFDRKAKRALTFAGWKLHI